jgi:3'-5' exoribonuclease
MRFGLLEHTLTVTNIAMDLFKHHPKLDKDLLIAGALLHDIGKIKEFEVKSSIKVSIEGQLIGHIIIGAQMLNEKLKELKVSKDCCLKLNHILISHHGNLEYGSPKKPAFPEALVIYYADELDSKTIAIIEAKETAQTEDAFIHTADFGNVYLK